MAKFISIESEGGKRVIINVDRITHIKKARAAGSYIHFDAGQDVQCALSPDELLKVLEMKLSSRDPGPDSCAPATGCRLSLWNPVWGWAGRREACSWVDQAALTVGYGEVTLVAHPPYNS